MLKFLLRSIKQSVKNQVDLYSQLNPWSNMYGAARSFMALSLLLTLLFTDSGYIFISDEIQAENNIFIDINFFYIFGNMIVAKYLSIVILVCIIIGYLPQITGILHWWLCISFLFVSPVIEGGDQLNTIITFLLIPITITDNRKNHWNIQIANNRPKIKILAWLFYFLISLQVAIMYFQAGIAKLDVEEWVNGTAVYYWATHNIFGVNELSLDIVNYILSYKYIIILVTWGTILLEIVFFGWFFMKRNSWNWLLMLLLGFCFHIAIIFLFGLFSFFFSMLGAIILYYAPKHKTIKLFKK